MQHLLRPYPWNRLFFTASKPSGATSPNATKVAVGEKSNAMTLDFKEFLEVMVSKMSEKDSKEQVQQAFELFKG